MKKAKILHLRDSTTIGSPEKLMIGQIKELSNYYDFFFCSFYKGSETGQHLNSFGIPVLTVPCPYFNPLKVILTLRKLIIEYNIDLICTHDYKSNYFGSICHKICKVPSISVFHGRTSHDFKIRCYESVDNFVLRCFDKVITVSEATRKRLVKHGISEEKIEVIYNAVDIPKKKISGILHKGIRKELGINKDGFLIATAGRLSKEKGFEFLINAMKIIVDKNYYLKPKLLIIGDGPEIKNIQRLISELELTDHILLTGFRNDIDNIFEEIDLFVLPSLTEGMPLVILEAFSHKKPVISTNVGGVPEMIEDNKTGFLVEKANSAALAKKIVSCIENPEKMEIIGHNGFLNCQNKFNFKRQSRELKKIYDSLIG